MRVNKQISLRQKTPPRVFLISSKDDLRYFREDKERDTQKEYISYDDTIQKLNINNKQNTNITKKDQIDSKLNSFKNSSLNHSNLNSNRNEPVVIDKLTHNKSTKVFLDPSLELVLKLLNLDNFIDYFLNSRLNLNDFLLLTEDNMDIIGFNMNEKNRALFFIRKFLNFSREKSLNEIIAFAELFPYFNNNSLYQTLQLRNESKSQLLTANFNSYTDGNSINSNKKIIKNESQEIKKSQVSYTSLNNDSIVNKINKNSNIAENISIIDSQASIEFNDNKVKRDVIDNISNQSKIELESERKTDNNQQLMQEQQDLNTETIMTNNKTNYSLTKDKNKTYSSK